MFEFDKYEAHLRDVELARPRSAYAPFRDVAAMSFMVWGEHCVECAAPACYSNCDLFQARPDGRCRRFAYGTFKNPHFPSLRGYGAEVSFKKWAKLEARGNTLLESTKRVLRREQRATWVHPTWNLAGRAAGRVLRDPRFDHLTHSLLERQTRRLHRAKRTERPDAFLAEIYNPMDRMVRVQLSVSAAKNLHPSGAKLPIPVMKTLELAPGYQREIIGASAFEHVTEGGQPFDIALTPFDDDQVRLVFLGLDFVKFTRAPTSNKELPDIKCAVFDLDNTLWDGVLLENPRVEPFPGMAGLLRSLDARGILLSVASKNDHDQAWNRLCELGLDHLFLYPQIHWAPKSHSIRTLAERLNIGVDTFAFIDDSPFERSEVRAHLPTVLVIDAQDVAQLTANPRFSGSTSREGAQRRRYYREAMQREEALERFGDDDLGFIASCEVKLRIDAYEPSDLERVAELVQRTNQLNFSGRKYTRDRLEELLSDDILEPYVLRCADRFGDYGTVGFSLVRYGSPVTVDDFMLSCRVQGKLIEQGFFHFLTHEAPNEPLHVNFNPTDRNSPALSVLDRLGFVRAREGGRFLDPRATPIEVPVISVVTPRMARRPRVRGSKPTLSK